MYGVDATLTDPPPRRQSAPIEPLLPLVQPTQQPVPTPDSPVDLSNAVHLDQALQNNGVAIADQLPGGQLTTFENPYF